MFSKSIIAIALLSASLMSFQALSREAPAMQEILTQVSNDVCSDAGDVKSCLFNISLLAKLSETTGKGASLCEGHDSYPGCSVYMIDSKTIDAWYETNKK